MANESRLPFLPAEIRLMILELLAQEKHGLASYASVCKEWAAVIEKKNFARLKLRPSCLDDLENMVGRQRRRLVRHIWLNIELQPYTCPECCQWPESHSSSSVCSRAISKLFTILAAWNPTGHGLTLELSAQSPSDAEHWFKNYYFGADGEDEDDISESDSRRLRPRIHDPKHGWVDGYQVAAPGNSYALERLYEGLWLTPPEDLPVLQVVTKLVIRYQIMIERDLPKGLKRLSIFQDYNDELMAVWNGTPIHIDTDDMRTVEPALGAALAKRSLDLEQLSASFMTDARHFFQARQPPWSWDHLQSLVLTSRLLTRTSARGVVSDLLSDAGAAAVRMPKLCTMALWNGGKGEACAFIHRHDIERPSIIWRGTWDLDLEPRAVQAWERVASEYTPKSLRFQSQALCGSVIGSHGDAIHLLDLPRGVVDPVSLWQIRREASLASTVR
ncbi:hypothetical protein CONLIGDRAFT_678788 [Coniochaeta ligniaria NRRL 30616]|uniref:DUF6546 domain-containing protein n=1 Tax=Coniochaeta ligniaria NRRL 30616 TaxID=1408157 RepID=A0A1J7IZ04_9PEZI|nr:hypothetical protein CONLIGDRAFT_678788 [Coniochaeta ligniaria NRRL 30616]